ncbi:MAG: tetratricopeptide repeat protein, partial [Elusimicrobiota bacterium]|nr:tetratricopeptide repeat protein [Elusimicrobiota bacterium]
APEALYRAGKIYQTKLKIFSEAINLFGEVIKNYPDSSRLVSLSKNGIFNSPDYLPLYDGNKWIEGDSSSSGKNMRTVWSCQLVSTDVYKITKNIFAGGKFVTRIIRYYREQDFKFEECSRADFSNSTVLLLQYPFTPGLSWVTERDGRKLKITIVSANAEVQVVAGNFKNCLKVKYEDLNLLGSYKYEYYAPDVGLILTTVGRRNVEHRNTELLSYRLKEAD